MLLSKVYRFMAFLMIINFNRCILKTVNRIKNVYLFNANPIYVSKNKYFKAMTCKKVCYLI